MARVDELIALLPRGMAREPGARAFLEGILDPVSTVEGFLDVKAAATQALNDPPQVPDELVEHLAATVGIGRDFAPAFALTVTEQRRLIGVAVALWRRKGTRVSWRQVVLFLAGARALIVDWFEHRISEGSTLELHYVPDGETAGVGYGSYDFAAFVSDVWVSDPDGALNEAAVVQWLDAMRATNERINLIRATFIEDLQLGTELWDIQDPTVPGNGLQTLADGSTAIVSTLDNRFVRAAALPIPANTDTLHVFWLARVTGVGWLYFSAQDDDVNNGYGLKIDTSSKWVQFYKISGGSIGAPTNFALPQLLTDGHPYRWRVNVYSFSSLLSMELRWEGVLLATHLLSAPHTDGRIGFSGGAGAGERMELQQALVYRGTPEVVRIGPNP